MCLQPREPLQVPYNPLLRIFQAPPLEENIHLTIPAAGVRPTTVSHADSMWRNGTPARHAHLRIANPTIRKQRPRRTQWVEATAIGI